MKQTEKTNSNHTFNTQDIHKNKQHNSHKPFSYWIKKNWYYHKLVMQFYTHNIPKHSTVLHINCKNGYLLNTIEPLVGIGIDVNNEYIKQAQSTYPKHDFYAQSIEQFNTQHQFDYIIASFVTMEAEDIHTMLHHINRVCSPHTRVIIESYSHLWEPILWLTKKLQLRRPTHFKNWVSRADMNNFLYTANFESVTRSSRILIPTYIPLISTLCNRMLAHVPLFKHLCLQNYLIARPTAQTSHTQNSVSIIIPCRNEAGNIEDAVTRCPQLGSKTELIFVEGHSTDNTLDEIKRITKKYPEKNIRWFVQEGVGKGDAVRKGFDVATGDILMILDADLTTQPEELTKFFDTLTQNKGDFINGSRLVYGMESQAMTRLAFVANWFFSYLLSWIVGQRIKDTLCGTKVLWKKDYVRIMHKRNYFGLIDPFGDFDLLFGAARFNLKIINIPVHYRDRKYGTTNISHFKEVWFLLWMCVRAVLKFKK